jgi:SAM-dependent methyltransferase
VRKFGGANPLTGVDLNRYLLREAADLAVRDGVADQIQFLEGNAERLHFGDAAYDHAFTVTVLEECDADRALSELSRVVRPGGRVGVIVRATDMIHPWNIELPEALRQKVENVPRTKSPAGVGDFSLYRRMHAAGFESLTCFPMSSSHSGSESPMVQFTEDRILRLLSAEENQVWQTARKAALDAGVLFCTWPHHCVVGQKPAA